MTYLHLTIDERSCITSMLLRQESISQIARVLKRNKSTISRELKRNFFWNEEYRNGYYAPLALHRYRKRKKNCHQAANVDPEIKTYIEMRLQETWSPEQISCSAAPYVMPSFKTIYCWIEQGLICKTDAKVLRRKGRKALTRETRGKINAGKPIKKRDKSVYKRIDFGHWEADTMVSVQLFESCKSQEYKSRTYLLYRK